MKAIVVKYHGPTDTKGTRLSVHAEGVKTRYYSREYGDNVDVQAKKCAIDFCTKLGWLTMSHTDNALIGSTLPNGDEVFVFTGH